MNALFRVISKINTTLGVATFLLMCLVILYQVIVRYFFSNAQPWPEELGRYLFLVCTYASICLCVEENCQLRVEVLPVSFPSLKWAFDMLSVLSTILFYGLSVALVWQMLVRVKRMGTLALTMPIPMWILWGFIAIFCLFALLFGLRQFAVSLHRDK